MNYPEHTTAAIETTVAHLLVTAEDRRETAEKVMCPSYAHLLREQAEIMDHLANKLMMDNGREA